jgi:hypothetical protein
MMNLLSEDFRREAERTRIEAAAKVASNAAN